MKKLLSVFLCLALLCGVLAVAAHGTSCPCEPYPDERPLLVVLGDSIAAGWGVAQHDSAANLFAREQGYRHVNFAYAGNRTHWLLRELMYAEGVQDYVSRAQTILISIGGNDFMLAGTHGELVGHVMGALFRDDFDFMQPMITAVEENFAQIIAQLRYLNPDATVMVQTMFNPSPHVPILYRAVGVAIDMLNGVFHAQLAQDPDAFIIACVHTAFAGRIGVAQFDLIHPNARGHRVIAQVLTDAYLGTQTEIPQPSWCRLTGTLLRPVLWLVDVLLIRVGLRLMWPLLGGVVMRLVDSLVTRS
ncbi:MAG: SGNH/GDSL hydrolase family protein [Oscillospiraceae bacterium]|nr:SGNH/GDSL hydrolase family protein [Oscillospiraceae bacterium]